MLGSSLIQTDIALKRFAMTGKNHHTRNIHTTNSTPMNILSVKSKREPVVLQAGEGRSYSMGRMSAFFKADSEESANRYSISEWWLEPKTSGPGAHSHEEDDVFYVLSGVMSFLLKDDWIEASSGAFVLVPGGMIHDFENRSDSRTGVLNFSVPAGFESNMPSIVDWFKKYPVKSIGATS
jgi:mannose-6-phosphate isomerase-like protein (cupin superfamily)